MCVWINGRRTKAKMVKWAEYHNDGHGSVQWSPRGLRKAEVVLGLNIFRITRFSPLYIIIPNISNIHSYADNGPI